MTSRYIVIQPGMNDLATQVSDQLATLLEARGGFTRVNPLDAIKGSCPIANMPTAVQTVRDIETDSVLIDAGEFAVTSMDAFGWNLNLAASTNARVILALDTEGASESLIAAEIHGARARARRHQVTIAAVALPATVAAQVSVDGLAVLPLPLTEASLAALDAVELPNVVTPLAFQADLIERARANRKRIVLPEPEDDRVLKAAAEVLERQIAEVILVGDEATVRARAAELGLNIDAASIVSVEDPAYNEKYAVEFARLREKKGVTVEQARETVKDVSYFGTMMVHMGDADGMVSGAAHTTAHTIVPSFQIIKTAPGVSIVSSIFLMLMKDRVWAFGDCAVNPNPTPEQLADIAVTSARTAAQFGVEPRVAMLSYSTGSSGSGEDVEAVIEATRLAREKAPELAIEGPIQFDAAVDADVAATKLPDSPVAGQATVFVFPDLNSGNIGYKAVQRSSGAVAVGPVLQGLNKPVNDLSRGALVEDIVNTVALTAVQAQG